MCVYISGKLSFDTLPNFETAHLSSFDKYYKDGNVKEIETSVPYCSIQVKISTVKSHETSHCYDSHREVNQWRNEASITA